MSSFSRACLLLALLLLLAGPAEGQDKAGKVDEAAIRTKLLAGTYIEARLAEADAEGAERKFTIEYVHQTKKAKATGLARYTEAARRYNAALNVQSTALETIKELHAKVKEAEKETYEIDETPIRLQMSAGKNLVVRNLALPTDKDGKELRFTERQKLRGDGRYPGYQAQLKDLEADKKVRVYVDKSKVKAGAAKNDDTVYPITMIVLVPKLEQGVNDFQPVPLK
jgi:hypothetical protein